MSIIKNVPKDNDEVTVALRNAFSQRARWMKLLVDELKDTCDDWEMRARRAITTYGVENGKRFAGEMKEPGVAELPGYMGAKWARKIFEIEVLEENDKHYYMNFHHCPLVAGWQMMGCSDEEIKVLCDIAMDGDRGCACGVGVDFELGRTIAEGHDVCEIRFREKD